MRPVISGDSEEAAKEVIPDLLAELLMNSRFQSSLNEPEGEEELESAEQ